MKTTKIHLVIIFILSLVFFLPLLVNPSLITDKDNDLGRTYQPLFSFLKVSVIDYGQIPLWRPEQMMGETFIGNPLSSLLYPANIIFLIFPINHGLVFYFFGHFLIAGIFTYLLAKSFRFSSQASLAAAIFYEFSTKMLVHFQAGHITMIAAFAYFPLAFLAIRKNLHQANFKWIVAGAVALTFMYITYPTIFYYAVLFLAFYVTYKILNRYGINHRLGFERYIKGLLPLILILAFTGGLSAIVILPHLEFAPLSTRAQLALEDVAVPLWNLKRFFTSLLGPYIDLGNFDHEAFLYLGFIPSILAIFGFLSLPKSQKIIIAIFAILTAAFVAGETTPVFETAYEILPFLKYQRVTTRLWFVVALITALLAAFAVDRIIKKKSSSHKIVIVATVILLFMVEISILGFQRMGKISTLPYNNLVLYQTIARDNEVFRVYCTSYCFNPQLISKHKIQVLHGETPIQEASFIEFLAKAGGYKYSKFAVIFPPYQVWQKDNPPQPNTSLLGFANVKYVASTYQLPNADLVLVAVLGDIYLYRNNQFKPRIYFDNSYEPVKISIYSPNRILLEFNPQKVYRNLIISENFYPGWFAYANNQKFNVQKKEPVFRKVTVPPNSKNVELRYQPESLAIGKTITFSTIALLIMYYLKFRKRT